MTKKAIIIGAGPAGLTAAYELITRTDIVPVILEKSADIGGLSKTINYKGNRIDIGGHRFFSKSDRVMNWWLDILPLEANRQTELFIRYHNQSYHLDTEKLHLPIEDESKVMLIRNRLSRIFYSGNLFDYPIKLTFVTLKKLGFTKTCKIIFSYLRSTIFPVRKERSLEDFFVNRFGRELYETFFKEYTEKVWGLPCSEISAEWGKQRIKELSVLSTIFHAIKKSFSFSGNDSLTQKKTETSLIEKFLYPKLGPGQLWEEVANIILAKGGEIYFNQDVDEIAHNGSIIQEVATHDQHGTRNTFPGDYFFSSMPVKELIQGFTPSVPQNILQIAAGLQYRDFITVGLLVDRLSITDNGQTSIKDNWIYIQEPKVKIGRLQIFNNWSPDMTANKDLIWLGLEYFCNKGDVLWELNDNDFIQLAIKEMAFIGFIEKEAVVDSTIIRVEKAYPAYFGSYKDFGEVREFTDNFSNLFLIGRNGMHKYNNSDHSMLTAMTAVDNITSGAASKENIWAVNTENDYHENR